MELLYGNENKWSTNMCNTDESYQHSVEPKKPDKKESLLCDSTYTKFKTYKTSLWYEKSNKGLRLGNHLIEE